MAPLYSAAANAISLAGNDFVTRPEDSVFRPTTMSDEKENGTGRTGDDGNGSGVALQTRTRTKRPAMYKVLMLNDDYTPMEFVVMVLQRYFHRDIDTATHIMLLIHHDGRGVCGVYPKDVAATKVELVLTAARREGHPLQCIMEAA